MNVGIVGCGVIAARYVEHAGAFDAFRLVACADVSRQAGEALARAHGLEALAVDELLADPAIDAVLNLTPATAHAAVIAGALAAGKHVYSEKPLATTAAQAAALVAEAARRGLRVGCAPDTFLGRPYQTALGLIDAGAIGVLLAVSAAMLTGGQSTWHENPDIFYVDGAGPLLDMGPYYLTAIVALLGPVRRVTGFASMRVAERAIDLGSRAGERLTASTPTHTAATLELDDGVTASLVASFEATTERVNDFAIHGTEGSLALPDPNTFAGPLRLRRDGGEWREIAFKSAPATRAGSGCRTWPRRSPKASPSRVGPARPPCCRGRAGDPGDGRRRRAGGAGRARGAAWRAWWALRVVAGEPQRALLGEEPAVADQLDPVGEVHGPSVGDAIDEEREGCHMEKDARLR